MPSDERDIGSRQSDCTLLACDFSARYRSPVVAFHRMMEASALAVINSGLSGKRDVCSTALMKSVCAAKVVSTSRVDVENERTRLSQDPVKRTVAASLRAKHVTGAVWPR